MLDSSFAGFLKSIRPIDPLSAIYEDYDFLWKVIPWLIGLGAIVLILLRVDLALVKFTALGVIALMVWVEIKLGNSLFKKYLKRIHLVDVQWLCLKCKHRWVETKARRMK